ETILGRGAARVLLVLAAMLPIIAGLAAITPLAAPRAWWWSVTDGRRDGRVLNGKPRAFRGACESRGHNSRPGFETFGHDRQRVRGEPRLDGTDGRRIVVADDPDECSGRTALNGDGRHG